MGTDNRKGIFPFDVNGAGADRLRLAVKAKLQEFLEIHDSDDVLAEYVVVLVGHGKQQAQATADLRAFLGDQTEPFVAWLWDHLTANKQLYLADSVSIDTFEPKGAERQFLKNPQQQLEESASHFLGMEVSEMQKNLRAPARDACSSLTNPSIGGLKASQKDKDKENKEMDRQGDDLACSKLKFSEIRAGHSQSKRCRSPESWPRRTRSCLDATGQNKKEPIPIQVRATRRLLESAVRDAVAPAVNGARKNKLKCLRPVVSQENDQLASVLKSPRIQHAPRFRTAIFRHGGKVSPAMIVALKAAAAAAEDVNSHSKKSRVKIIKNVQDHLGLRNNERPSVQEEVVEEVIDGNDSVEDSEQIPPNEENFEPEEGMISDGPDNSPMNDRPEWHMPLEKGSCRSIDEEDALLLYDDVAHSEAGTSLWDEVQRFPQETLLGGSHAYEWQAGPDIVGHSYTEHFAMDVHGSRGCSEAVNKVPAHGVERHDGQSHIVEQSVRRSKEESTTSQYKCIQHFEQAEVKGQQQKGSPFSGRVSSSSQEVSLNAASCSLKDANKLTGAQEDVEGQKETKLLKIDDTEPPEINVLEMRKRMRQVELEMTKLRARQVEVTKEVQKVTATPASVPPVVKSSSQLSEEDDIDARSIFVTNVHFAATKDVITSHFSTCGEVVRVIMLTDGATGMPKGSAYVEFSSRDGMEKALKLNESNLLSRPLKVVRKEIAFPEKFPVVRPGLLHPLRIAVAPVVRGTFFRRPPFLLRSTRLMRPFQGGQRLHWKREPLGPHGYPTAPYFDGPPGVSFMPSVSGYRVVGGPIRHKRSLSYVRTSTGPPCETAVSVEEQKVG